MADRSTGPVKPPVIDLTARNANVRPEETATPGEPRAGINHRNTGPRFRVDTKGANWPLLGGVAVGGAVLGTVLTYIFANAFPLPSRGQDLPDFVPELAAQAGKLDALSASVTEIQAASGRTQISLDATIAQLDSGLAEVNKSLADVKASIPAAQAPVDLAPLQNELKTLKTQVDAMAAGASGADGAAIAQSLDELETGISSLTTRLNGVDSTVTSLRTDLDAARKTLSDHISSALPNEIGPALKLPLILSGLEGAFASGKPFQAELTALKSVLPDFVVPTTLAAVAADGLSRPDALTQKFETALPEILGARDSKNSDWTQTAVDWAKSLLALRPAEEVDGDSPEAIVSRLEGTMSRRDYAAALALIAQLPPAMQTAATLVAADIRVHAEADKLVADLRAQALTSTATP
ncbi:MAG: hypothetical protein ABIQ30_12070 [Devosia sp.]